MHSVPAGEDRNNPEQDTRGAKGFGHNDADADTIRLQLTVRELLL